MSSTEVSSLENRQKLVINQNINKSIESGDKDLSELLNSPKFRKTRKIS